MGRADHHLPRGSLDGGYVISCTNLGIGHIDRVAGFRLQILQFGGVKADAGSLVQNCGAGIRCDGHRVIGNVRNCALEGLLFSATGTKQQRQNTQNENNAVQFLFHNGAPFLLFIL